MAKLVLAIAGLVVGLVLGFWLGASQAPESVDVGSSRDPTAHASIDAPAPLAMRSAAADPATPASAPAIVERNVEPDAFATASDERPPDGTIRGIVVDSAGRPVAFAEVSGDLSNEKRASDEPDPGFFDQPAPWHVGTRTTRSGRFALGGLRVGGEYFVRTQYGGLVRADVGRNWDVDDQHIVAPADDVRLTLSQCRLEVEIIEPHGRDSLSSATVDTTVPGAGPDRFDGNVECKFTLGVPPDRPVRIEIHAAGLRPAVADGIVVTAAEATKHVTIPMTEAGSGVLRLTVVDDIGRPQRDVFVDDVTDRDHSKSANIHWGRSAPEQGTFVIVELPPGYRALSVRGGADAGLVPALVEVQVVESGDVSATAVLKRGGRLRVAVIAKAETFIQARVYSGDARIDGPFRDENSRDDVGDQLVRGQRYLFERGLEPGNYVLRWQRGFMGSSQHGSFRGLGGGPKGEVPFTVAPGDMKDVEVKLD